MEPRAESKCFFFFLLGHVAFRASLVAPAMQETGVRYPCQEDLLKKGMATHSSILAWRIPWTEEAGGLQPMGSQRVGHNWATNTSLKMYEIDRQSRFNAWDRVLRAGALKWPWGMGWGGRWVQDGEHTYTHGWFMSMYGRNHYNIVK